jgi:hypothetical protein
MFLQTPVPTSMTAWASRPHPLVIWRLALRHDFGLDVRAQVERDGIDRLVFLFDPDREGGTRHGVRRN